MRRVKAADVLNEVIRITVAAGREILSVYEQSYQIENKADGSPVTTADLCAHELIVRELSALTPNIPVLSEESSNIVASERLRWSAFWLVDPLDGTKEFIKRNGEFTVNIALIVNKKPVLGVIHIPVKNETYWGSKVNGSFYTNENNDVQQIQVSKQYQKPIRIVASRSHPSKMLISLLEKITDYEILEVGSSMKFCLIASGQADCYPRFGPTSEWDTAAGEAIVKFAGGHMVTTNGHVMNYNSKKHYLNPNFIVSNGKIISETILHLIK